MGNCGLCYPQSPGGPSVAGPSVFVLLAENPKHNEPGQIQNMNKKCILPGFLESRQNDDGGGVWMGDDVVESSGWVGGSGGI